MDNVVGRVKGLNERTRAGQNVAATRFFEWQNGRVGHRDVVIQERIDVVLVFGCSSTALYLQDMYCNVKAGNDHVFLPPPRPPPSKARNKVEESWMWSRTQPSGAVELKPSHYVAALTAT